MAEDHAGVPVDPARVGILAVGNLIIDKTHRVPAYPAESFLAVIAASSASPGGGAINVLFDLAQVDPALPLALAGDDVQEFHLRMGVVGAGEIRPAHAAEGEGGAFRIPDLLENHAHGSLSVLKGRAWASGGAMSLK